MGSELTAVQVEALQINLKDSNRAERVLPVRHLNPRLHTSMLRGRNWRQHGPHLYVSGSSGFAKLRRLKVWC